SLKNYIDTEFSKNVVIHYERHPQPKLIFSSNEKYLPHGQVIYYPTKKGLSSLWKVVGNKSKAVIPPNFALKHGVIRLVSSAVIDDIIMQNIWVNKDNLTYLTNRTIDIDIINHLHIPSDVQTSDSMLEGLSHTLPIVEDVPLDKLIELRIKDGEA